MDKETLSNYGWIVICVLVLSVLIALATPFGSFVSNAVQNTTEGLFKTEQNAMEEGLKAAGVELEDVEFDDVATVDNSNSSLAKDPTLNHAGIIPEGATYMRGNQVEITSEEFPQIETDDIYLYGDYRYISGRNNNDGSFYWAVYVVDKTKTEYSPILESINGYPVTDVFGLFSCCTNLETAPKIHEGITSLEENFICCSSLITVPKIPVSVKRMSMTFYECTNLTQIIEIPCHITDEDVNSWRNCPATVERYHYDGCGH